MIVNKDGSVLWNSLEEYEAYSSGSDLSSSNSSNPQIHMFPTLDRGTAFYGLAGDIVRAIEPHSEADPVAVLVQLLVGFGNAIGRSAHFSVEADDHYTNLFAVIVGASAKGRKGTSWSYVRRLLEAVEPEWVDCMTSGLTSGEGLIHHVKDVEEDFMPGAIRQSKRALVVESEFASVLRVQKRDGNTLSAIIRQAWDTGTFRVMRRKEPEKATNAHISIIGHITDDELRKCLQETDALNGYANRFLWVCARRSKRLPEGGSFNRMNVQPLVRRLSEAAEFARAVNEMRRDEEARQLWIEIYNRLDEEESEGIVGSILARAEAQILRLACVYALFDCSDVIRRVHLEAAYAVWKYCEDSARYIFGGKSISLKAQKYLDWLSVAGESGLNKTELTRKNGGRSDGLDVGLAELNGAGLASMKMIPTRGRMEERWFAAASSPRSCESDEFDEESQKHVDALTDVYTVEDVDLSQDGEFDDEIAERAAVLQFDGGYPSEEAERLARLEFIRPVRLMAAA